MKKIILSVFTTLLCANVSLAQTATIDFNIKNSAFNECNLIPASEFGNRKAKDITITLNQNGFASYILKITEPQIIRFFCVDPKSNNEKYIHYTFFISPGDKLYFKADMLEQQNGITVTGRGSKNNQPALNILSTIGNSNFYGDTIPDRVINAILKEEKQLSLELKKYISINNPSEAFIKMQKNSVQYYAIQSYFSFKENNKFRIKDAYARNYDKWMAIQDSLLNVHKLDNEQALCSFYYTGFINNFIGREKERLWNESYKDPDKFYKEWYGDDIAKAKLLYDEDPQNLLREKVINKYFKGKTAEYLYSFLIEGAIAESNPKNVVQIYENFKVRYPKSKYDPSLKPLIDDVVKKQQQTLNDHMVFADTTGKKFNTMDDLLQLVKGKTVLVDMWGTWCSPCREEIEKNSAEIKKYFKEKGLDYVYVSNYDLENVKQWKALIAYFNLEGTHILAGQDLSDHIMKTIKGNGFPTYFIIKKDGSFELSKAGYPMNRQQLIKQLEEALGI